MKRLLTVIISLFVLLGIYYDLSRGTLSVHSNYQSEYAQLEDLTVIEPYIEVTIQPGDTVLSIMEQIETPIPVPLDQLVRDFEELNNGVRPELIQIGKTYKFPLYNKDIE